jgi:hypothetical protein
VGGLCTFLVRVAATLVVIVNLRAVAAGDGVHGEYLAPSAQDYGGGG